MISTLLLVLGSAAIALQEATAQFDTREINFGAYTTIPEPFADSTLQTTFNQPGKSRIRQNCKNQFNCDFQEKSTLSKHLPREPSKNLVPPFTQAEEEDLKAAKASRTAFNEAEAERVMKTTLAAREASVRSVQFPFTNQTAAASNELKSYLPPSKLTPSAAQVDLNYLPPNGVLPQAAAASLDIARVNYLAPLEVKPAAAQIDATQIKPEHTIKDICTDSFHSFLCAPLKSRKRITGALPDNLVPREFAGSGFVSPAASNAVQNSVTTIKPSYLPPSLPPTRFAPQPSNVDRSYLPPAPKPFSARPSLNAVKVARPNEIPVTDGKPFATSTPRPFVQTTIIPIISPKLIDQIVFTPTAREPKTATMTPKLFPEPSDETNRGYLPPVGTERPFDSRASLINTFSQRIPSAQVTTNVPKVTTTPRPTTVRPIPEDRSYLPPSPNFEPAAAAQVNQAVAPASANRGRIAVPNHDHHDHDHHHHHDRDICTDPFHSFLCAPLKQRRRITGALPSGFSPQSSNRKEARVRPGLAPKPEILKPENTFQSESRIKSAEEVPSANAPGSQIVGYQYPKPTPTFPLPTQTSQTVKPTATTGYQYPKPSNPLTLPSQQKIEVISKEDKTPAAASPSSYQYPKPTPTFPLPTQTSQTVKPTATTGYQYPKPSNPLTLPSQQKIEVISKEDKTPAAASPSSYQYPKPTPTFPLPTQTSQTVKPTATTGYQYPKPSNPLPLPSQQTTKVIPQEEKTTAAASPTGYQYPKPAIPFILPSESQQSSPTTTPPPPRTSFQPKPQPSDQSIGYQYPKPQNQLVLPSEGKSVSDLGSAEFIPVNKIDAKRQVRGGFSGSKPRFGDRIRKS